jgi:hypothetical protein
VRYGNTSGYSRGGRSISKPRNLRGFRDASGQLVFDPDDENLSDKELYARNIPAIGSPRDHLLTVHVESRAKSVKTVFKVH